MRDVFEIPRNREIISLHDIFDYCHSILWASHFPEDMEERVALMRQELIAMADDSQKRFKEAQESGDLNTFEDWEEDEEVRLLVVFEECLDIALDKTQYAANVYHDFVDEYKKRAAIRYRENNTLKVIESPK